MTYQHKEAFCLMKYASRDGAIVEWLWNSRDGVTPFIIRSVDGSAELYHVDWHLDRCVPGYKPQPGQRIFIDSTPELLQSKVVKYVETFWDNPNSGMAQQFANRDEAIAALLAHWHQPGAPMVIMVEVDMPLPEWEQPRRVDGSWWMDLNIWSAPGILRRCGRVNWKQDGTGHYEIDISDEEHGYGFPCWPSFQALSDAQEEVERLIRLPIEELKRLNGTEWRVLK